MKKELIPVILIIELLLVIFSFLSCNTENTDNTLKIKHHGKEYKEPLINANKHLNSAEDDEINGYIKRHRWPMTKTNSGLRYWIFENGKGAQVKEGTTATYSYKLSFINGFLCYTSEKDGNKTINIGLSESDKGLQEALLLMKKGDKAKIIIPSYLAYGLIGDGNKIPAKATLVYDLEIINLK